MLGMRKRSHGVRDQFSAVGHCVWPRNTFFLPQAGVSGKASFSTWSRASSVRLALKSRGERYFKVL